MENLKNKSPRIAMKPLKKVVQISFKRKDK